MARLNFRIDRLTDSIRNTISGDSFATDVIPLSKADLKQITKKLGWNFNWKAELDDYTREVYKVVIRSSPEVIHGLVSIEYDQGFVFMHLVESAPFNIGKNKIYEGVPGNLVAFAW